MSVELPDVDLDVKDRDRVVSLFKEAIPASQVTNKDTMVKHVTGLYFQHIPTDPTNGLATFPFSTAEDLGYYKVDMIPNHVYDLVGSEDELQTLLDAPVDWSWFQDEQFFKNEDTRYRLTHLSGHYDTCKNYPPKSTEDIAILLAVIRPRKRYLVGKDWDQIKSLIWKKIPEENPENDPRKYFFKKSHSFAFAMLVILHAQLIARRITPRFYEEDEGSFF